MPTLGEVCYQLHVSRRTLDKWLTRCNITPERHPADYRFYTISDEDIEKIRQTRAQMPGMVAQRPRLVEYTSPDALRRPTEGTGDGRDTLSPAGWPSYGHYRPSQEHSSGRLSASQEALAAHSLPEGWVARSSWCRRHNLNDRAVEKQSNMPPVEIAPSGEPWGSYSPAAHIYQPVREAYRVDQLTECVRVAQVRWPARFRRCEDPECPCNR